MGQALYRRYRPKSLVEIVGQEHVTTTLANALKAGRVSHAYLLSGPRGVGKTSIARILAHEINGLPYGDEAHLDIIEIDAASNRRIDEIRDLRDRVNTAPAHAKYKVYIIDEVHMLTKEAFNALLKTLEEPPAHVVFVLATTEAHKLPETIISRTQRYSLRPVPEKQVIDHLKQIATGEKLKIDDEALALIAKHGDGSFRDSISLLDQASSSAEHVTRADIERILGLAPDDYITRLNTAVTAGNSAGIVTTLAELYGQGFEPTMIASQLSASLRQAVLDGTIASPETGLSLLQKLLDVPAARSPKQLLELVLLQTALAPAASIPQPAATPVDKPKNTSNETTGEMSKLVRHDSNHTSSSQGKETIKPASVISTAVERSPKKTEEDLSIPLRSSRDDSKEALSSTKSNKSEGTTQGEGKSETKADDSSKTVTDITELWQQALDEIKKQYNTLYGIARMAHPSLDGNRLTLLFKFAFHQKRMSEAKNRKIFADIMERLHGRPLEISCVVGEAEASTADMSAISNIFGGAELLES
ncbi:MAG TPA: DNA polymerase III subunit gamma/tau [Candidatus Saccharimonadales bacterium]|nr:DNA polymerase III subunit gamma/tau [Candidatus Saccharimonadales bacterium]